MPTTLIYDDAAFTATSATARGTDLWLSLEELQTATGWQSKPQGLCRDETCIVVPPDRRDALLDSEGRCNVSELARLMQQPVIHDADADVWLVGAAADARRVALQSLSAPDFRLPDLDGKLHALSDYRGRKVLLLSWASW